MQIITLVENTTLSDTYRSKHGLSLYIETKNHKILFDLGPNKTFLENAKKLSVDIAKVDTLIISHGHIDHCGALEIFLKENKTATIYAQESVFDGYFTKVLGIPFKVGVSKPDKIDRFKFVDKILRIDDELLILADIKGKELISLSNKALYRKVNNNLVEDDFHHEQSLIICEEGKYTLIAGCAHKGIVNIQNSAESILDKKIDYIISGFHLFNPVVRKYEKDKLIQELGDRLAKNNTKYFTCHCTGDKAFKILKDKMRDKIDYISTGSEILI